MFTELMHHRVLTEHRQSVWDVRRTFTDGTHKIRATIHHDPYEFQAHAYAELFNPRDLAWNRVHEMPTELWYRDLNVLRVSEFKPHQLETVDHVCEALVAVAQDLLEGVDA